MRLEVCCTSLLRLRRTLDHGNAIPKAKLPLALEDERQVREQGTVIRDAKAILRIERGVPWHMAERRKSDELKAQVVSNSTDMRQQHCTDSTTAEGWAYIHLTDVKTPKGNPFAQDKTNLRQGCDFLRNPQ